MTTQTREQYFIAASEYLLENLIMDTAPDGLEKPPFRVSIGWPRGSRGKQVLGQCFPRDFSEDKHNEIFLSPTESDTAKMLATLVHELIHAVDDCKSGHKNTFASMARACGLEGKLTATYAGEELEELIAYYIDQNGPAPVAAIDDSKRKKDRNRQLKVECSGCGFLFRASRSQVDKLSSDSPCPCCHDTTLNVCE